MDQKTIDARIAGERQRCIENIMARTERPKTAWWLSFCDGDKPEESQFLGVLIFHANDFIEAISESHMKGLNPGGECQGMKLFGKGLEAVDERWKYRLLSKQECEELDTEMQAKLGLDHSAYDKP